jgi:HD superfamily phosphohydrolase
MSRRNRIRTLLYGDQRLLPGELDLISTPSLQRLYDLHQLGLADRVFLDASHSRLHHVVGVLEQVDRLTDAISRNLKNVPTLEFWISNRAEPFTGTSLSELVQTCKPVARLIGLLHDLTHAPFGHTVEDEIELISCKHDDPNRQADAFYRLLCQYIGWLGRDADVPRRLYLDTNKVADTLTLIIPTDLSKFI